MNYKTKTTGISLIELIVVLSILSLLMVIGFPSYQKYLIESRRYDGINALRENQLLVEDFLQQNGVLPSSSEVPFITTSPEEFYTITYELVSGERYRLTANAATIKSQINDTGCTTLTLSSDMDGIFPINCN